MIEGIPRLTVLNERVSFSVQSGDWQLLVRTLTAIETTEWEEPLKPHVATILTNGRAALSTMIDQIAWTNGFLGAEFVAKKIERMAKAYWRKRRTRRALRNMATELRRTWCVR